MNVSKAMSSWRVRITKRPSIAIPSLLPSSRRQAHTQTVPWQIWEWSATLLPFATQMIVWKLIQTTWRLTIDAAKLTWQESNTTLPLKISRLFWRKSLRTVTSTKTLWKLVKSWTKRHKLKKLLMMSLLSSLLEKLPIFQQILLQPPLRQ